MAHIHTDDHQHDLTASAFIIRTDLDEPAVMMHEHKLLKKWLQFGGHVELHEDPWQAVRHEIVEESGYDLDQLELLQPKRRPMEQVPGVRLHPMPFYMLTHPFGNLPHYHTDIGFIFFASGPPRNKVGDGESESLQAFTIAEIDALPDDATPRNLRPTLHYIFDSLLPAADEWEHVAVPPAQ
jgi:8-oxo-dGTP pyrophosphatase MutT (NUDIX family)